MPLKKGGSMNPKRFLLAWIGVFVVIFGFEWLFHGMYMKEMYLQTASLWRTEAEMHALFHWMLIGQFLFAGIFSYIFTKGYENKGIGEGVRYGFLIGLLMGAPQLIMYAVAPYPMEMIVKWIVGGIVEFCLAGVAAAALYRPARM
jgi:hypothetical protein